MQSPFDNPTPAKTIRYGSEQVDVLERAWQTGARLPYRKTYVLKPGESWFDADVTPGQWEHYVLREDGVQVPVGAVIAAELKEAGAVQACFVELWHGCVLVDESLTCVGVDGPVGRFLERVKAVNDNLLGGLPDVVAVFPDGRVALREAKNRRARDRLGPKQHQMADLLREHFPEAEMKVVAWG